MAPSVKLRWLPGVAMFTRRRAALAVALTFLFFTGMQATFADDPPASRALSRQAEQGDAGAQFQMGVMYRDGRGLPEDLAQAKVWFRKAADQGNAEAEDQLGYLTPLDNMAEAAVWFLRAAEHGNADAQYRIAVFYEHGHGVEPDSAKAIMWYRRAAEQGDNVAQFNIGYIYEIGEGVPQSFAQAALEYRKIAVLGDPEAIFRLGTFYEKGMGTKKNVVLAYIYYNIAAGLSDKHAPEGRDRALKKLTGTQVISAQRFSLTWHPGVKLPAGDADVE